MQPTLRNPAPALAGLLCVLLALVALETLLSLVLEMYRPRVKGKIGRPLYESRVVGLLGHQRRKGTQRSPVTPVGKRGVVSDALGVAECRVATLHEARHAVVRLFGAHLAPCQKAV